MITKTGLVPAVAAAFVALATCGIAQAENEYERDDSRRTAQAQNGPGPGPIGPGPGCNIIPGAQNVGATPLLSEFPSFDANATPTQVGMVQLIKSGQLDMQHGTMTLPLYRAIVHTQQGDFTQWFILTDSSDEQDAQNRGLNFAKKLGNAGAAARDAVATPDGAIVQGGLVDFGLNRRVVPGSEDAPFPPRVAKPGSAGDQDYSPIMRVGGIMYNAPVVASGEAGSINFPNGRVNYDRVHDQVLAIDPIHRTVTMNLVNGYSFGRPVFYISTDTSDPAAAAIERNTYAPRLNNLERGIDDIPRSAVERIFIAVNGQRGGCANPQRQGLNAALEDGFRPNNTFGGIPFIAGDYSPIWDAQVYEWAPRYVRQEQVGFLNEEFRILALVTDGVLTGPNGAPFGSAGFVIDCAVAARLN